MTIGDLYIYLKLGLSSKIYHPQIQVIVLTIVPKETSIHFRYI